MGEKESGLKKRILEEMTVGYSNILEKNFDLAKQLVRISKDGKVDVLVASKVTGKEQLLLYLIGKMYAKEAGLATTDEVGNGEFVKELGVPIGSVLPWLKDLRDANMIEQTKHDKNAFHAIRVNQVEHVLALVSKKVKKE